MLAMRKFFSVLSLRGTQLALSIFLISYFLGGCARGPRPSAIGPVKPISVVGQTPLHSPQNLYHVVGPSETLWRISKIYGIDMKTLLQVNHLDDPTKIKNGQKLLIPQTLGPKTILWSDKKPPSKTSDEKPLSDFRTCGQIRNP